MHLVGPILIFQIPSYLLDKIRRQRVGIVLQMQNHRRGPCVRRLRRRNFSIFQQGINHKIAALHRALGMVDRRINPRTFGQTGKQRRFRQRKFSRRLAEVVFRCRLEPVHPVSQENLIGV